MSKFKIGDKVVGNMKLYEQEVIYLHYPFTHNKVYNIERTEGNLVVITADDGVSYYLLEDWFKLSDEQLLSKAFEKAVEEVGETFVAKSLIERKEEMNAEQIRDEILRIDVRIEEAKKDIENAEKERNSLVEKLREKGFEIIKTRPILKDIVSLDEVVIGDTYIVTNNFGEAEDRFVGKRAIVREIDYDANTLFVYINAEDGSGSDWMHYKDLAKI